MKTEAEIRKYRDALKVARYQPCDCRGTVHHAVCVSGGHMMDAAIGELSWVLDEWPDHDRCVETVLANAARQRAGG